MQDTGNRAHERLMNNSIIKTKVLSTHFEGEKKTLMVDRCSVADP